MTSWKLKQEEKAIPKKPRDVLPKKKYRAQQQTEKELDEEAREIMHDINFDGTSGETSGKP